MTPNSIAALLRPKTVCAYPGINSELRNASRGLSGGVGVVSAAGCAAMPARALSRCCAGSRAGAAKVTITNGTSAVAGECGNRTHPTPRCRVTVILKITEATRPHPPPLHSEHFDRNVSPKNDLANYHGTVDP